MKSTLFFTIAVLVLAACSGQGGRMRRELHALQEQNQADSVFTSTQQARRLADYFDRHGTPNEQMLAHYLLGRAYSDLNEAPMALESYSDAAEATDTSSSDCDFRRLSIVHIQMASLFYHQNLMNNMIHHVELSEKYALKAKDTLLALTVCSQKVSAYSRLNNLDSTIAISERISARYAAHGQKELAAVALCSSILPYIKQHNYAKAKRYINIYETASGRFDAQGNISRGYEIYYYTKGLYYLAVNKLDSAEYVFRKELREGRDFNNQNAASRGLALLFQKAHRPDSAAKYALYSYEMNDSVYAQMVTERVLSMQSMHDYSRNQRIAQEKTVEAQRTERRLWIGSVAALVVAMAGYAIFRREKERRIEAERRRRQEEEKYKDSLKKLERTQYELIRARESETRKEDIIHHFEQELARQKERLQVLPFRMQDASDDVFSSIKSDEAYIRLSKTAQRGAQISDEEWASIKEMLIRHIPKFIEYMSSVSSELNILEYNVCLLTRLYFKPSEISNMLGISQPYVTKLRNALTKKLFADDHTLKEFDSLIRRIS